MKKDVYQIVDICEIKSGKRLPKDTDFADHETDYPYIRARDIKNGKICTESLVYLEKEVQEKIKRYVINSGDIAITIVGASVGDVGYATPEVDGYNLTENAVRLTSFSENVNSKYLFYILYQKQYRDYMQLIAGAAAQPKLGIYKVQRIKVELPNIETQNKIVDILSAYDELIENNNKRITILEQMAENLYKEWFVRFRFPGYETTEFEDGIPYNWEKIGISDVYDIKYGKTLSTSEIRTSGEFAVYGANGVIGYYDKFNCDNYVTLITSRGNGSGDVLRTHHKKSFITNNSFTVIPKGKYNYLKHEFTYWSMKNVNFKSVCSGAAQPQLTNNSINSLSIILPDSELINSFCNIVENYFALIENLLEENENLTKQRDLLLPRLMSGKLEV